MNLFGKGVSDAPASAGSGLLGSAHRLASTALASVRTRLELLGNELEEEKLRLIRVALLGQALMLCAGIAVVLGFAALATLYWEQRLLVLTAGALLFLVLAGLFYAAVQRALLRPQPMFASSLNELEEDIRQLKAAMRDAPPAE
nr:phage holin family protein [Rhodocyclus gracilis]